jgi:signal transduction histidine kinase
MNPPPDASGPILVVDDDPVLRSLARAALENDGFKVEEAGDGEEACRVFDACSPQLLVIDVVMPVMNGYDLCRALRGRPAGSYVPILMATGLDDVESITQAYDAGATDFISKPLNWTVLCHRVRYLLRASRAFDEVQQARLALVKSETAVRAANEQLEHRVEERTQELRAAQDALLKEERFSTIGHMTATVAHELRNPLGAISNSLYLLRQATAADGTLGRAVERGERSIVRCNKIINNLLDYTVSRTYRPYRVGVDQWLESVLAEQSIPDWVEVERHFDAPGGMISADSDRLSRAVTNLIENAVQAIDGAAEGASRRIIIATRLGEHVEIAVTDTSPGIPADVLPQIFEPLFSTRSFGAGWVLRSSARSSLSMVARSRPKARPAKARRSVCACPAPYRRRSLRKYTCFWVACDSQRSGRC